jgi:hypothetical protein
VRDDETITEYFGLSLVPDSHYSVEIRAWRLDGDTLEFSEPVLSNGLHVIDPQPPTIDRFEVAPNPLMAGEQTLITIEASDDDRVAGMSLELHDADGLVRRLSSLSLAHPTVVREHPWDGTDGRGNQLVGDFRIVARMVDRGGREARAERPITVLPE